MRAVKKFWRSRQASWWKPEPMMEQAIEALRNSEIFPLDAFDSRNEEDAPPLKVVRSRIALTVASNGGGKFKRTGPDLAKRRKVVRLGSNDAGPVRDSRGRIS